ncbi:hypothetical protein [Methanoculleus sp.]|uniref:hypothetical protein n=1 Tax=Methanoculleus sp. TaxID=90427 RepID=UPI001BD421A8|nr:hypothetical protein [Methanoculleus sp.]
MIDGDSLAPAKASGWKIERVPKGAAPPPRPAPTPATRPAIKGSPAPLDIVRWLRGQGIMPLPCRPKSKSPISQISRRGIYGDNAPAGDSFHIPTPERMAAVKAWWVNEDYHQQATVKDCSISVPLHPDWNNGRQVIVLDIDDTSLCDAVANAPALERCPVGTGKKGAKLFAFLDPDGGRPESPIVQYAPKDDPDHPALEIFTGSKHALIYGEHPDSTRERPILYAITRGFGEPFPVLTWKEIKQALEPIIQENGLVLKESGGEREPAEMMPTRPRLRGGRTITDKLNLSITDVCTITDGVRCGDEVRGSHPVHGSTTGQNFAINPHENTWHCFRCGTGGGPVEWIAVEAEIIDCSAVRPGCLHGHWREVFDVLRAKGYEVDPPSPEGVPDPEITLDVEAEALEILEDGDPVEYLLDVFHSEHVSDDTIAKCCYVSAASRVVENTRGLHVLTTGPSGKGKSSSYDSTLKQTPKESQIGGTLSDRALFYHDIPERAILVLDDKGMSEGLQELFRGATSDFREPEPLRTVGARREPIVKMLPPRCVWWMASADDMADDQFHNRCLQPWCDDSEEADREFFEHMLREEAYGEDEEEKARRFAVCRAMWSAIGAEVIPVWVPFAPAILFGDMRNRRNGRIFVDLIKCFARIRFMQRPRDDRGRIVAAIDDFRDALTLYHELTDESGSQVNQLTPDEARILRLVELMHRESFNRNDLVAASGLPPIRIYRILHGRAERGTGGLLEKCPALTYQDVSVSMDSEGIRHGHREMRYYFDVGVYRIWSGRGAVTLDMEVFSQISQSFPSLFPTWEKTQTPHNSPGFPEEREREEREREKRERFPKGGDSTALTPARAPVHVLSGDVGKDSHPINEMGVEVPHNGNGEQKTPEQSLPTLGKEWEKTGERQGHPENGMGHNTPLPGAIDPEDLIAAPPHQTKCQVCQSRPATLKSRDGQVWICDVCQRIILRARAREMGVQS